MSTIEFQAQQYYDQIDRANRLIKKTTPFLKFPGNAQINIKKLNKEVATVQRHANILLSQFNIDDVNPQELNHDYLLVAKISVQKKELFNFFKQEINRVLRSELNNDSPIIIDIDDIDTLLETALATVDIGNIDELDIEHIKNIIDVLENIKYIILSYDDAIASYKKQLEKKNKGDYNFKQNNANLYLNYNKDIYLSNIKNDNMNLNKMLLMSSICHNLKVVLNKSVDTSQLENIKTFLVKISSRPISVKSILKKYTILMDALGKDINIFEQEKFINNENYNFDILFDGMDINKSIVPENLCDFINVIHDIIKLKVEQIYNMIVSYVEELNETILELEIQTQLSSTVDELKRRIRYKESIKTHYLNKFDRTCNQLLEKVNFLISN